MRLHRASTGGELARRARFLPGRVPGWRRHHANMLHDAIVRECLAHDEQEHRTALKLMRFLQKRRRGAHPMRKSAVLRDRMCRRPTRRILREANACIRMLRAEGYEFLPYEGDLEDE